MSDFCHFRVCSNKSMCEAAEVLGSSSGIERGVTPAISILS